MQVSSKLVYTLIFKQVVYLIETTQYSFGVLSDETVYENLFVVYFFKLWNLLGGHWSVKIT